MSRVDTNVVAYLLMEGNHTAATRELRRRDRQHFFGELKRRNVCNVAVAYTTVSELLIQAG